MDVVDHKHKFKMYGQTGLGGMWRCECGKNVERDFTPTEKKIVKKYSDYEFNLPFDANVHRHFHPFAKIIDAGKPVGKYVDKHSEIMLLGCDDDAHASSDLILIPHESDYDWMGLTVQYIPQCTGEEPIRFFLYPGHLNALIEGLQHFQKQQNKKRPKNKTRDDLSKKIYGIAYNG